jgi:xylulokinase
MKAGREMLILAIDLGTSGPKVALVDTRGRIERLAIEETDLTLLGREGAEQDPGDWWAAIGRGCRRLFVDGPDLVGRIGAVSCTSQWSGTVPVDREGRHLANAIIWMDSRGAPYAKRITHGPLRVEGYAVDRLLTWIRLTGGVPDHAGKDSIAHILYLKHQHPELYAATHKFLEPKDYLNLRLTGKCAASFDSITLHWVTDNRDINAIDYDERLLRLAGLDRDQLPDLKAAVDVLGPVTETAAAELGIPAGIPVVMGTPDLQSAALGSGAIADYEGHLYIGTSSWLSCHVPFKKTDVFHKIASLPSAIPGRYFVTNEQETAGACLAFLRDAIFCREDALSAAPAPVGVFPTFDILAAEVPPGSDGVIFTPWLNGERAPVDDRLVRGGFHNLSLNHHRGHLLRAVMEGVAFNTRWLLKYVERFTGRPFGPINAVGGGANSALWCQIMADVLDRPIRQMADPVGANARGAAMLASVALGGATFEAVAQSTAVAETWLPDPARQQVYDKMYGAFIDLYKRNRRIYHRLNR